MSDSFRDAMARGDYTAAREAAESRADELGIQRLAKSASFGLKPGITSDFIHWVEPDFVEGEWDIDGHKVRLEPEGSADGERIVYILYLDDDWMVVEDWFARRLAAVLDPIIIADERLIEPWEWQRGLLGRLKKGPLVLLKGRR